MHIYALLSLVLGLQTTLVVSTAPERTTELFAWPLSASKAQLLAKITYTATNASIKSLSPPKIPAGEEIVRVGFYRPSGSWSGIATAASNFLPGTAKRLQLHVKEDGELYHVGFKIAEAVSQGKGAEMKDGFSVKVIQIQPGPLPHLNKPVVLNAEGKLDEKEPEKSFIQK